MVRDNPFENSDGSYGQDDGSGDAELGRALRQAEQDLLQLFEDTEATRNVVANMDLDSNPRDTAHELAAALLEQISVQQRLISIQIQDVRNRLEQWQGH